jgi:hypothetical protein
VGPGENPRPWRERETQCSRNSSADKTPGSTGLHGRQRTAGSTRGAQRQARLEPPKGKLDQADLGSLGTLEGHGAARLRAPRICWAACLRRRASGLGIRSCAFRRFVGRVQVRVQVQGSRSGFTFRAWGLGEEAEVRPLRFAPPNPGYGPANPKPQARNANPILNPNPNLTHEAARAASPDP